MNQTDIQLTDDLISGFTQLIDHDIALELAFLRQANRILRSKLGKRAALTDDDRNVLVQYGIPIKDRLEDIISIVKPETLLKWYQQIKRKKMTYDTTPKKPGRPSISEDIEKIVIKITRENRHMGYVRISGELKKPGHLVSPTTIFNIFSKCCMDAATGLEEIIFVMF